MNSQSLNRRRVLGAGLALAGAGVAAAACDTRSGVSDDPERKAIYPGYHPATAVRPDQPAPANGMPLYLNYPSDPPQATTTAPGRGGQVRAFVDLNGAAPPVPVDNNPRWKELNRRLNAAMSFDVVPSDNFAAKAATIIAGGDLPDLLQLKPATVRRLPDLLERSFTDLTEYLAGDAVTEYPALANIPTVSWRGCAFNGKIFGVPQPRSILATAMLVRRDVLAARGLPTSVASGEEFQTLCKALTEPRSNRWAVSNGPGMLTMLQQMYGAPNNWRQDDGRFTHRYETDQCREGLSAAADMWRSGVMHPDAWAAPVTTAATWFYNGSVPIIPGVNWGNLYAYYTVDAGKTPGMELDLFGPVGASGHTPAYWVGPGFWGFTCIPKAEPERARELLGILNYLASPFGSEEWLFLNYGIEGTDYRLEGTNPIRNTEGRKYNIPSGSITVAPQVMYQAGLDEVMKRAYSYQQRWLEPAVVSADASVGLVSETSMSSGLQLDKQMTDLMSDVALGRKNLNDWDTGVADWRRNGGDAMRVEFEQSFQAQQQN